MRKFFRMGFSFAASALLLGATLQAHAAGVADYYKGKQITVLLGTGPGRTYDLYARLLTNHIVSHIPGKPSAIVQYMPGAGGLKATNYLYNAAPKDGSMIATLFATLPSIRLFKPDAAKYDPLRFNWLGAFSRTVNVLIVNKSSPAASSLHHLNYWFIRTKVARGIGW